MIDSVLVIKVCVIFSLLFSLIVILITLPKQRFVKLWERMDFRGKVDGKYPKYLGKRAISPYTKELRFRSGIPLDDWKKIRGQLEVSFKKEIYSIERDKEDITVIIVFVIEKNLPKFIPWDDKHLIDGAKFAIGESYKGPIIWDASTMPHGLIAGSTGSGKTGILRCIIHQAIKKYWNINVLDFKGGGDFTDVEREAAEKYRDLEKGYGTILISDPKKARDLLMALTIEAKGRLEIFKKAGVANIDEYNQSGQGHFVPRLVVIDEAAELLDVKPKDKAEKEMYSEIDHDLRTLARTTRAAGIHILMNLIRPSADVLDGQIKNNLLWRACGYFSDPSASRIVLDNDRATQLPTEIKGRFIVGDEETQVYYMPPAQKPGPEE